ncbi:MAG: protein kinase [Kiritimatiellaeota bacterium]|nr:protein kinase [Kiritimatiellota bacterium]
MDASEQTTPLKTNEKTNPLRVDQMVKPLVLIVDDDDDVAAFLTKAMEKANYSVITVANCADAIDKLVSVEFDLLLTDVNLPDASGTEILQKAKELNKSAEVIMITGAPDLEAAVDAMKNGAFDYLSKPIDIDKLFATTSAAILHATHKRTPREDETAQITNHGFKVVKTLGSGTMGTVLLVERHGELFAMKILRNAPSDSLSQHKFKRFIREARILSKIDHPNVVKVIDYGIFKETRFPYILMEFVSGHQLYTFINKVELDLEEKRSIIRQLASALAAVHKHGIIHRDVKPANVVITTERVVKLTDFGIAHMTGSHLTVSCEMLGSPAYMAPEAFDTRRIKDERADIFSLGVIAYELFTGRKPFFGDTMAEIMHQVQTIAPVEPLTLVPDLPPYLQDIMAKMLAKDPDDRFKTASQIVKALDHECAKNSEREGITSRLLRTLLLKKATWR